MWAPLGFARGRESRIFHSLIILYTNLGGKSNFLDDDGLLEICFPFLKFLEICFQGRPLGKNHFPFSAKPSPHTPSTFGRWGKRDGKKRAKKGGKIAVKMHKSHEPKTPFFVQNAQNEKNQKNLKKCIDNQKRRCYNKHVLPREGEKSSSPKGTERRKLKWKL